MLTWCLFSSHTQSCSVNYAVELSKVMNKIIMLGRVAALAASIEQRVVTEGNGYSSKAHAMASSRDRIYSIMNDTTCSCEEDENESMFRDTTASNPEDDSPFVIDSQAKSAITGQLTDEQKAKIARLLGAWEEPSGIISVEVSVTAFFPPIG